MSVKILISILLVIVVVGGGVALGLFGSKKNSEDVTVQAGENFIDNEVHERIETATFAMG